MTDKIRKFIEDGRNNPELNITLEWQGEGAMKGIFREDGLVALVEILKDESDEEWD